MTVLFGWLAQRLGGVTVQAMAIALAAALVVGGVVGGLSWLRHDARRDERAGIDTRVAQARAAAAADALARQIESETKGRDMAAAFAVELEDARAALAEAERKLAAMAGVRLTAAGRVVCYPREIVGAMNR